MKNISIASAQQWVKRAWLKSPKSGVGEVDEILFLLEEMGEAAETIRILKGQKKGNADRKKLEKELADIFLCLLTLSNRYQVDLQRGFVDCQDSIKKRYIKS